MAMPLDMLKGYLLPNISEEFMSMLAEIVSGVLVNTQESGTDTQGLVPNTQGFEPNAQGRSPTRLVGE
jgi:hypothetical protein